MTRPQIIGAQQGAIDAMLGKSCDPSASFNRSYIAYRYLVDYDRAEYAKSYRDAYSAECRSMRREGRL